MTTRRTLLTGGLSTVLSGSLAAAPSTAPSITPEAMLRPPRIVPLWPGAAPGRERVTVQPRTVPRRPDAGPEDVAHYGVVRPTLGIVRPDRPNGRAILVVPGGGYTRVASSAGGGRLARFLAARGYLVGTLIYRLPYDGWADGPAAPLQDAQRALRLLKQEAGPGTRTGVIGFSAGGHLAGCLATRFGDATYAPVDAADAASPRPDFAGLFIAVLTMTDPFTHAESRRNLLGKTPSPAAIARWSIECDVPADTPPCFLAGPADDPSVPIENSIMMFAALRARMITTALHIFDKGGHTMAGLDDHGGPGRFWPDLFEDWLSRQL